MAEFFKMHGQGTWQKHEIGIPRDFDVYSDGNCRKLTTYYFSLCRQGCKKDEAMEGTGVSDLFTHEGNINTFYISQLALLLSRSKSKHQ